VVWFRVISKTEHLLVKDWFNSKAGIFSILQNYIYFQNCNKGKEKRLKYSKYDKVGLVNKVKVALLAKSFEAEGGGDALSRN